MQGKELTEADLTEAELTYLYENVGGRPSDLIEFVESCQDPKEWVHSKIKDARDRLNGFPSQHQPLLALLKKNPEGVDRELYDVNKKQFGLDTKDYNVVYYDMGSNSFKLQSQALKVALKDYTPQVSTWKTLMNWLFTGNN